MNPDHLIQQFSFSILTSLTDHQEKELEHLLEKLGSSRQWSIAVPGLFEKESPKQPVGGYLDLYSAVKPESLPREVDLQQLEEVSVLVDALENFSSRHLCSIEFTLDDTFVGSIEQGVQDRLLKEGLLGEWKRQLMKS